MRKTYKSRACRQGGTQRFLLQVHPHPLRTQTPGAGLRTRTGGKRGFRTREQKPPENLSASSFSCCRTRAQIFFRFPWNRMGPGSRPPRGGSATPGAGRATLGPPAQADAGPGPLPTSELGGERQALPGTTAQLRPSLAGRGRKVQRRATGPQSGEERREEGWRRGAWARQTREARPCHPCPPARPPQQKTPDPAASLPTAGGRRVSRAPGTALPGRKGLSGPVSPKFMVWFLSRAPEGRSSKTRGETTKTHEEKTPNSRPGSVHKSLGSFFAKVRERRPRTRSEPGNSFGAAESRRRAHTSSAAEAPGGGRSAPAEISRPALATVSRPLLRRAGPGWRGGS